MNMYFFFIFISVLEQYTFHYIAFEAFESQLYRLDNVSSFKCLRTINKENEKDRYCQDHCHQHHHC